MGYSVDLRQRVIQYVRSGGSKAEAARLQTELAAEFGVRPSTIHDARRRLGITRKKTVALRGKRPTETPPIPTAQRTLPSPRENLALPG